MLQPKRVKHRKHQRGKRGGIALTGNQVSFGEYGIQALEPGWITARQIEAARRTITHHLKRGGKVFIRIFPDKSVTAKPAETRMGSGKGAPDQLEDRLRELREELFNLRFQYATRQLTNTARIREVRRDIARILTQQRQLEL